MSSPSLELEMRMRGQSVQTGLDKLAAAEAKVEGGLEKISKNAKSVEKDLERFAKQTERINATPVEKYNKQVERLDAALKRGLLSQTTHSAALARAKAHYENAVAPAQSLGSAIAAAAVKYGTFQTALSVTNSLLSEQVEKTKEAQRSLQEMLNTRIEMGQVGSDKSQIASLTKHGLTRAEAGSLVLQGQNLGLSPADVKEIAKNRAGLGNVSTMATMAGDISALSERTVSPLQAINQVVAAAGPSKLAPSEMGPLMARAMAGLEPSAEAVDERMAAVSLLASKYPSPAEAATQVGSFSVRAGLNDKLKGKSLADQIRTLQTMPEAERLEFAGKDKETNQFLSVMGRTLDELPERQKMIRDARLATGTPQEPMAVATRRNLADPTISSALKNIAAEEERKSAVEQRYGVEGADATATKNVFLAQLEKNRLSGAGVWGAGKGMEFAELLGARNPKLIAGAGAAGALGGSAVTGNWGSLMSDPGKLLKAIDDTAAARKESDKQIRDALNEQTNVLLHIHATIQSQSRGSVGAAAAMPLH